MCVDLNSCTSVQDRKSELLKGVWAYIYMFSDFAYFRNSQSILVQWELIRLSALSNNCHHSLPVDLISCEIICNKMIDKYLF